ncbi:hypothetical protein [Bacillus xiapuensis]|uniref:hypothetical protein n=1 Tax=Bacillus xiapuensis TaxID=2014075 RepID=UPI000C2310D3|nr:hypothetical protein [Bacillus xiapuensis]
MEFIGWASLATAISALIYLAVSAAGIYKSMKPKINHLQGTAEKMKEQQFKLQSEAEELKLHQKQLMQDMQFKKDAVVSAIDEAKKTPPALKQLAMALTGTEEKNKFKLPDPQQK